MPMTACGKESRCRECSRSAAKCRSVWQSKKSCCWWNAVCRGNGRDRSVIYHSDSPRHIPPPNYSFASSLALTRLHAHRDDEQLLVLRLVARDDREELAAARFVGDFAQRRRLDLHLHAIVLVGAVFDRDADA